MSRFTEKMYRNAATVTTGMVTGEPHDPVRHTWGEVHERARRVAGGLAAGDPAVLAPLLGNELQAAAVSLESSLRRTLRAGTEAGALAGIVSGSGPTCAFLCPSAAAAVDVGTQLAGAGVCRTVRVASGPVQGARVVPAPTAGV